MVSDGQQVLEAIKRERFELILMDVQMPIMGGMEATVKVRELEMMTGTHVPIIALTAHAMEGDRKRFLAAGMDDYLSKPIDPQALHVILQRWLVPATPVATANATASATATPLSSPLPPVPSAMMFDTQALLDRVGGRQELLQDMIELFLGTQPQRMQELRRVSDDRDMVRLSRLAHTLAGSFSTMSMDLAALLAREIQRHANGDEPVAAQSAVARLEQVFEQLLQQLRTPTPPQAAPVQVRSNDQHGS